MRFRESYSLPSFAEYLHKLEERTRTLFHEKGHDWMSKRLGASVIDVQINVGGISSVFARGIKGLKRSYRIGVAGLLAEAYGLHLNCPLKISSG